MAVLLFAAFALIGFRLWLRLQETSSAIEALTERVIALEQVPLLTGTRVAREPEPKAPSAAIVDEAFPTSPVPPAPVVRPRVQPAAPPPTPPRPPTLPVAPAAVVAREPARSSDREALESRIGSRWLLYVGVVAIVIGVSYFEKLAIENHWVNETWRVIQGGISGLVLIGAGLRIVKKGYRFYGHILAGTGVAILYVSTYAAFNFYHLISHPVAFTLMSAISIGGTWLANAERSQGLALVAVAGGFATPFLLPTATNAEVALFGYDTILIAGTMVIAQRRDWPTLNIVSYAFTALTFLSWAQVFYASATYLTTELFLTLFCGLFLYALHSVYQSTTPSAGLQRLILWTAPLGYYVLSLANLFDHSVALLIYLVILALVGVVVGSRAGSWIRLLFWFAVAAPLLIWSDSHGRASWLTGGLAAWAGAYILNLAGLLEASLREDGTFDEGDIALLHANALTAFLGAYLLINPVRMVVCAPLAAGLAILQLGVAYLVKGRRREQALHFVALAATLLTIAIALQLDGAWITSGWATEGVVITWLGLRERRSWLRSGGLALFGAAILRLVVAQTMEPRVGEMVVLNGRALSGLFIAALTYLLTYLHHRFSESAKRQTEVAAGLVLAKLVLLAVAISEIVAFWQLHVSPPFEPEAQAIGASFVMGAVIMGLGLRRREEWVRALGAAVTAAAVFSLLLIQSESVSSRYVTLFNGRFIVGASAVFILYGLLALHRRGGNHLRHVSRDLALLSTAASILTMSLLTSEITAYWHVDDGRQAILTGITRHFAREMMLSLTWAGYATILVIVGLIRKFAPARYFAIVVFAIAIVKVFGFDLTELDRIYRVLSIIGLGLTLLVTSYLYQRLSAEASRT